MLPNPKLFSFHNLTSNFTSAMMHPPISASKRHMKTMSKDREVKGRSALRMKSSFVHGKSKRMSNSTKIICPGTSTLSVYSLSHYLFFAFNQLISRQAFALLLWSISHRISVWPPWPVNCRWSPLCHSGYDLWTSSNNYYGISTKKYVSLTLGKLGMSPQALQLLGFKLK